jgi:ketosteroid isomerase-like protein
MSEQNVEFVRRMFAAGSRGGALDALDEEALERVYEFFDPEIVVKEDPRFPEAGTFRGPNEVRGYFARFTEQFDVFRFELDEVLDPGGDKVLVLFEIHGRGTGSGADFEARPGWLHTIRDGKVARIEAYLDRREALEAAGLAG